MHYSFKLINFFFSKCEVLIQSFIIGKVQKQKKHLFSLVMYDMQNNVSCYNVFILLFWPFLALVWIPHMSDGTTP
jgi:hypothetical protein